MVPSKTVTQVRPLPAEGWGMAWVRTASVAILLLVAIFLVYEVVERTWLVRACSTEALFRFHIYRGVGTSIVIATWAMVGMWRTRRRYDRAFAQAYQELEAEADARMRALARSEAFTEHLFDSLRDRLIVLDRSGRVVKANRVAQDAMSPGWAGRTCQMLGQGCVAGAPSCLASRALREGRAVVDQIRTDAWTGHIYSLDAYPVPDPEGGEDLVIEAARDITEAKQVEVRLRSQEKLAAIGVLSAGIAHDIANPLASMSSELEMLEAEQDLGRVRESLGVVRKHVSRITRTLRDMTDFARRRADEPSGTATIEVCLQDALRMVRHDPRARRIRIETHVAPDLPQVQIPEDQLVMALVNLVINAFDAMPGGGVLTLRGERGEDGGVRVGVEDTGVGMAPEVRKRAAEPLFTTKPGGTGLGLSVTRDLMSALSGRLEIDSEEGRGTRVTLHFPPKREASHG